MLLRNIPLIIVLSFIVAFSTSPPVKSEDKGLGLKEYLEKSDNLIKAFRHFEAADELEKAAKLAAGKHPSLHMRLATLYYGLGLIPEAIAEAEKAVTQAPSAKWYKYDLAKFYYVDKQFLKAEEQFAALLQLDPGFTLGYYYLAELYYRKKEYGMAWFSYQRALLLGHRGKHLEMKLTPYTNKPTEDFTQAAKNTKLFRFITLASEPQAQTILDSITQGKLFENLELELKKDVPGKADFGIITSAELKDSLAESLRDVKIFATPVIINTGTDFRIMQRIAPFEPELWRTTLSMSPAIPPRSKEKPVSASVLQQQQSAVALSIPTVAETPSDKQTPPPVLKGAEQKLPATQLAAFYALESWKNAWQVGNVEKYLMAYSKKFNPPDNMTIATWENKRRERLSKAKFIRVEIKEPVVEMFKNGQIRITFKQHYTSDVSQEETSKAITMAKEGKSWKIIEEQIAKNPVKKK